MGVLFLGMIEFFAPRVIDPAVLLLAGGGHSGYGWREVRRELGLDDPWYVRALSLWRSVNLNNKSLRYHVPIRKLISSRLSPTLSILAISTAFSLTFGLLLGVIAYRFRLIGTMILFLNRLMLTVPVFVLASVMAACLAGFLEARNNIYYGSLLLGLYASLWFSAVIRSSIKQEMAAQHHASMRALGYRQRDITLSVFLGVLHHLLGALDLFLSVLLTGGTVVVEYAFHIEGLGLLLLDAVHYMDLPVIRFMFVVALVLYTTFAIGILMLRYLLDPRMRLEFQRML